MVPFIDELGILSLGTRLRLLSEEIMSTVKAYYTEHALDFEPRYFPLFQLLHRHSPLSLTEAAKHLGISHAAVNGMIPYLTEKGLVAVSPDSNDARAKSLTLTEAGNVLYARLTPAWFALEKALKHALPSEEILAMLRQVEATLSDKAIGRSLRTFLGKDYVEEHLRIVPYDDNDPEHKKYFAAFNIEWLQEYFFVEPVDYEMFASPKQTILDKDGSIVMALVGDQIVGTGALIKRGKDIYEIAKMAVSRPFQGHGIGRKIVEILVDDARARRLKKVYLVSSTKLPHAVPLYRKMGFVDCDLPIHEQYKRSNITLEKALA